MGTIPFVLFCISLLVCLIANLSVLYALGLGVVIFFIYALIYGVRVNELIKITAKEIWTVRNILITVFLIGILTALWRAAGTIPTIICYSYKIITPQIFIVMVFLLNCLISFLIGTELGTAATVGVICATMAKAMGINLAYVGGAVVSGAFFGDRCSPLSTSALLVADLTKTNIYNNIKNMIKIAAVPFTVSVVAFAILGQRVPHEGEIPDLFALFGQEFKISPITLIPVAAVLILALFRVNVKIAMLVSILLTVPIGIVVQHLSFNEIISSALTGYSAHTQALSSMISGGGVKSMFRSFAIVGISASYFGVFKKTDILDSIKKIIMSISKKSIPFVSVLITSIISSAVVCNQTLTIMLTSQICDELEPDKEKFALDMADSSVIIPPLVPWSIACTIPLSTLGAPLTSLLFGFYLYAVPIWHLIYSLIKKKKSSN